MSNWINSHEFFTQKCNYVLFLTKFKLGIGIMAEIYYNIIVCVLGKFILPNVMTFNGSD